MNICLNQKSIRVRLSDCEFTELKSTGKTSYNFAYWPLQVNIIAQPQAKISIISTTQLDINIESSEVNLMISPDIKKSGLNLIAEDNNGKEILLNIQVDILKNSALNPTK